MSKHRVDTMTTAALRDLDPAPTTVLTDDELERADATFARILATPSHGHVPEESDRPRRRLLLVPVGLVGAAGAAVLALLLGGGSAFASWTPKPEPLTAAAVSEAATTCRAALEVPDQGGRVVIAERRGGWTYVLIAGPQGEGTCLMPDDLVGRQDPADHSEEGFFGGYTTDPVGAPTLARDRIVETDSMAGSVPIPGLWPFSDHEGWFSSVQGYVGRDVTGVTVHTPVGPDVEASVANGRFAAWWPSDRPSSENPGVMGAWTYTVTLADGSTRRVTG
jgi:threonine dehydrogenase-like Zn-dependent dehydrogenase